MHNTDVSEFSIILLFCAFSWPNGRGPKKQNKSDFAFVCHKSFPTNNWKTFWQPSVNFTDGGQELSGMNPCDLEVIYTVTTTLDNRQYSET